MPVDDAVIGLILGAPVRKSVGLQNASGANLLEDRIINPDRVVRVQEVPDRVDVLGRVQRRAENEVVLMGTAGKDIAPKLPIENVIAFVADQSFASDIADDQIVAVATFAFSMRERASPLY